MLGFFPKNVQIFWRFLKNLSENILEKYLFQKKFISKELSKNIFFLNMNSEVGGTWANGETLYYDGGTSDPQ